MLSPEFSSEPLNPGGGYSYQNLFTLPSLHITERDYMLLSPSLVSPSNVWCVCVCIKDGWGVELRLILSSRSSPFIPLRIPYTHFEISLTSRYNHFSNCDPLSLVFPYIWFMISRLSQVIG